MKETLNNTESSNSTKPVLCNGLRIGNLFRFGNEFKEVVEIIKDAFYVLDKDGTTLKNTWADLEPIKPTKEILTKMGFFIVETNGTFEATLPNFRYSIQTAKDYDGFFFCDGETVLTNFNYLHELQNLFFVLGQRELTVA